MSIEIGSVWRNKKHRSWIVKVISVSPSADFMQYATVTGDRVVSTCDTSWLLDHYELHDMVNHPPHYKDGSGVGCTEVVKHMMYFGGACFKYLYRCGKKHDDIEDLKKAVRCAELADDDRFITDESWLRAMYQVASHRDGNIRDAMFNIRSQQWEYVIECIKAEIARLESE